MKIEDLDLSVRAYNCLKRVGIDTVEQIRERDAEEILRIRNLGKKCFDEIMEKINCIRDTEYSELLRKLREDWTGSREEAARAIEDLQSRLKDAEKSGSCKWISVDDRMPELNKRLLTYRGRSGIYLELRTELNFTYDSLYEPVKFWMPLPEAPLDWRKS